MRLLRRYCQRKRARNRSAATIAEIWRGPSHAKHLHQLDNDFFGQPRDQWEARIDEIRTGGFRVCINQGINVRMVDDASAKALASIRYTDDSFTRRRLYTAWDSLGDEGERFFDGVATLERYGGFTSTPAGRNAQKTGYSHRARSGNPTGPEAGRPFPCKLFDAISHRPEILIFFCS